MSHNSCPKRHGRLAGANLFEQELCDPKRWRDGAPSTDSVHTTPARRRPGRPARLTPDERERNKALRKAATEARRALRKEEREAAKIAEIERRKMAINFSLTITYMGEDCVEVCRVQRAERAKE